MTAEERRLKQNMKKGCLKQIVLIVSGGLFRVVCRNRRKAVS